MYDVGISDFSSSKQEIQRKGWRKSARESEKRNERERESK